LSSCKSEFISRVARFGVETDEEFSSDRDADDHFGFSGFGELAVEGAEALIEAPDDIGDEEENRSDAGAATLDMSPAGLGAAIVGERRQAGELGHGLIGVDAELGQFGEQPRDGAIGQALDAQGRIQPGPQRIVVDERTDLVLQGACLALEQGNDLVDAGRGLIVDAGAAPLLLTTRSSVTWRSRATRALRRCCSGVGGVVGLRALAIAKRAIIAASSRSVFSRTPMAWA